jgi:hypothetical protein
MDWRMRSPGFAEVDVDVEGKSCAVDGGCVSVIVGSADGPAPADVSTSADSSASAAGCASRGSPT